MSKKFSAQHSQQIYEQEKFERYRAFMTGYVKRINEASFRVKIGGVRIGSAKYTRLAQINLSTRIITFSKFAVENVPERGRRYLVLHELAHVKEASHNKRFWQLVGQYEPNYREIGRNLEKAFKENVKNEEKKIEVYQPENKDVNRILAEPMVVLAKPEEELLYTFSEEVEEDGQMLYDCEREDFLDWIC